jgi:Fur family transcriptional regulator, ferric uptake regulator
MVLDILKKNQLSVTEGRKKILELFMQSNGALAHADIEKKTGETFDRVTVYRTLNTFVEKGIIHLIPTTDNSILYALCKDNCEAGHHHDNHVHFICEVCGKTICLDEVTVPEVKALSLKMRKWWLGVFVAIVSNFLKLKLFGVLPAMPET